MAHTLIVMRHAKSSWKTAEPDHRRPLSPRGVRDATVAGGILAGYRLDRVLSSSSMRTRQTWQTAELGGARCAAVVFSDALYGCWPEAVVELLAELDEAVDTALVLGHEPTMSGLIAALTAAEGSGPPEEHLPTSAIAVLEVAGEWAGLAASGARLVRVEVPRG